MTLKKDNELISLHLLDSVTDQMRKYLSLYFVISFVKCKAEKCDLYSSVATTVNYRTIVINQENFYH